MSEQLLDKIGKRLPYNESDRYVDDLVERTTSEALARRPRSANRRHMGMMVASAAAALALIIGVGITLFHDGQQQQLSSAANAGPLDEFLNNLSDEEAAQLQYYEIEEIPEY